MIKCEHFLTSWGKEDGRKHTKHSKRGEYSRESEAAHWLLIKGIGMQEGKRL